jgi:putative phosphoesterase
MMGILADSHDNLTRIRQAMAVFKSRGCRLLVHAGDIIAPFAARELAEAGCPVKAVFGNCDGEREGLCSTIRAFGEIRAEPFIFEWEGLRILLGHLDRPVARYAAENAYDIIIFGHTHKPEIREMGKTLIVNPGEAGGWLHGRSTVALLDPRSRTAEILPIA